MASLLNRATDSNSRNIKLQNQNEDVLNSVLGFNLWQGLVMIFNLHIINDRRDPLIPLILAGIRNHTSTMPNIFCKGKWQGITRQLQESCCRIWESSYGFLCFMSLWNSTQNLPFPNPWFKDNNTIHTVKHKCSLPSLWRSIVVNNQLTTHFCLEAEPYTCHKMMIHLFPISVYKWSAQKNSSEGQNCHEYFHYLLYQVYICFCWQEDQKSFTSMQPTHQCCRSCQYCKFWNIC